MKTRVYLLSLICFSFALSGCEKKEEAKEETKVDATASASPTSDKSWSMPESWLKPEQISRGRVVYEKHCQECHGVDGKGQPGDWRQRKPNGLFPPPPLDDTAHAWHHPTEILKKAIKQGSPPDVGDMPPWEGKLTEAEIDDVIVYIKSLWSPEVYRHWLEIEHRYQENQ